MRPIGHGARLPKENQKVICNPLEYDSEPKDNIFMRWSAFFAYFLLCTPHSAMAEMARTPCARQIVEALTSLQLGRVTSVRPTSRFAHVIEPLDFVQIRKAKNELDLTLGLRKADDSPGFAFADGMLPAIGQFKYWDRNGFAIVEITLGDQKGLYRVPQKNLGTLSAGNAHRLEHAFDLIDVKLSFQIGENVRFRDASGVLKKGRIQSFSGNRARIFSEGHSYAIDQEHIFKNVDGSPRTIKQWNAPGDTPGFDLHDPALQKFLNGAARLASLPAYQRLPDADKLQTLVQYVRSFIPYDTSASYAEYYGLRNFSQIVCAGGGTCRHQATLLAQILTESGIPARLTGRFLPQSAGGSGHRWLEADLSGRTFVVDASSNVQQVIPIEDAMAKAAADPKSFEAMWFANPERVHYTANEF